MPGKVRGPAIASSSMVRGGCNLRGDRCVLCLKEVIPRGKVRCLVSTCLRSSVGVPLIVTKNSDRSRRCFSVLEGGTTNGDVIFAGFIRNRTLQSLCSGTCVCILPDSLRNVPVDLLRTVDCSGYYLASSVPRYARIYNRGTICFGGNSVRDLGRGLRRLVDGPRTIRGCESRTSRCVLSHCG